MNVGVRLILAVLFTATVACVIGVALSMPEESAHLPESAMAAVRSDSEVDVQAFDSKLLALIGFHTAWRDWNHIWWVVCAVLGIGLNLFSSILSASLNGMGDEARRKRFGILGASTSAAAAALVALSTTMEFQRLRTQHDLRAACARQIHANLALKPDLPLTECVAQFVELVSLPTHGSIQLGEVVSASDIRPAKAGPK